MAKNMSTVPNAATQKRSQIEMFGRKIARPKALSARPPMMTLAASQYRII